jgi:hypothetical protein
VRGCTCSFSEEEEKEEEEEEEEEEDRRSQRRERFNQKWRRAPKRRT